MYFSLLKHYDNNLQQRLYANQIKRVKNHFDLTFISDYNAWTPFEEFFWQRMSYKAVYKKNKIK